MISQKDQKKILIIGQGITGTMLSWYCTVLGLDFILIDDGMGNAPSKTAAGIINPVTGRRIVTVWMDDILLPFAEQTYTALGSFLQINAISKTHIIDFFPNPFMKENFLKKINQQAPYIRLDENNYSRFFNYEFGSGLIDPVYIVHLEQLLPAWRKYLSQEQKFMNASFSFSQLEVKEDKVIYDNIEAEKIIFCDGAWGNSNPYFSMLPFALNKGEAIIIEAPELPWGKIYKKSMTLAPFGEKGTFWIGSNYLWDFDDDQPTEAFRKNTEDILNNWLKIPYKIIDHKAAIRPATVERRPFAGFHPLFKNVGILNGMGTKGCSLAPFFAHQLIQNILYNSPIEKEADIARHSRILARTRI
ncbi:MAG: FAD-dependent oxidoreductase [Niabella sp.]